MGQRTERESQPSMVRLLGLSVAVCCACGQGPARSPAAGKPPAADADTYAADGWVVAYHERFEDQELPSRLPRWQPDELPDDGPFSDAGEYFRTRGVVPPRGYRISAPTGQDGWLTIEAYSRSGDTKVRSMMDIVPDPAGGPGRVMRLASPAHTDAVIIRSTRPLPPRYRISARIGHVRFGDGRPNSGNGYDGGERAEPWLDRDATAQNGFYWLAILDTVPRPHNNVWIHHQRKVVIDSDNHYPPWMEIWNGQQFVKSGERPVMMFAVDGAGEASAVAGKPFLSWAAGELQPSGSIRAVDSYVPETWYRVAIERTDAGFVLEIAGRFRHGGDTVYRAVIDVPERCVWHHDRPGEALRDECVDLAPLPGITSDEPAWPAGRGWPDYFMLGDPHINYYEGELVVDDIRLEVPAPSR